MTAIVFCLGKRATERNASNLSLIQDLERDDIEGHLLEQLLKPSTARGGAGSFKR